MATATGADRFIAELDEEYYLHYAGLKRSSSCEPIYERHAELTDLETIAPIGTRSTARRTPSSGGSGARASWAG